MTKGKYEIHISDVRAYRQCRRRWWFSSRLQHNLEPNIPYMPFFTGRCIHEALDAYYSEGINPLEFADEWIIREVEQMGTLWQQEMEKINTEIRLIKGMLHHYLLWIEKYEGRFADDNLQFIALETDFRVPLRNEKGNVSNRVFFAGRFDGVVMTKSDGKFWLWETKTAASIDSLLDTLTLDEQCGAYIFAAQQLFNVDIQGVIYNIMRKKAPVLPQELQNGMLSKRKKMDTSAEIYLRVIREHHDELLSNMNSDEQRAWILSSYGDMLQVLLDKGNTFFARIPIYRTAQEVHNLSINLWHTALEMCRPTTPLYPAPSWSACNFCRFKTPCISMNAGGDWEAIVASEYRQREHPTFEIKE